MRSSKYPRRSRIEGLRTDAIRQRHARLGCDAEESRPTNEFQVVGQLDYPHLVFPPHYWAVSPAAFAPDWTAVVIGSVSSWLPHSHGSTDNWPVGQDYLHCPNEAGVP